MPEPFVGTPDAPIWLLNLNPGFDDSDLTHDEAIVAEQRQAALLEANRFWMIDPQYSRTAAYGWWSKRLRKQIEEHGRKRISTGIFVVEFFPYHSRRFHASARVHSQKFSFDLVREGVRRGKCFVFMRARRAWLEVVPELADAETTHLRSNQGVYLTRSNLADEDFFARHLAPVS